MLLAFHQRFTKPSLRTPGFRNNFVFQLAQRTQQFTGFKWLDDKCVGPRSLSLVWLEWLQLPDRQQHRDARCLPRVLDALAHLESTVAWHVDVKDNQVRFMFGDFLQRGRTVIDSNDFVTGIGKDSSAHVLGGHTVIGKQYFARQGMSFGVGR